MSRSLAFASACLVLFGGCGGDGATDPPNGANSAQLQPDMDNTLYEDSLGLLSNGAGQFLFAGVTNQPLKRRTLLHFDIVGSQIPAGATIDSVTLSLHMSRTNAGPTTVRLHLVTTAWGEAGSDASGAEGPGTAAQTGDATWLHTFFTASQWTIPGGDFATAESASTNVQVAGFYTWSSAAMVADIQNWLDNSAGNFGWVLIGDESAPITAKRFDSRENGVAGNRPVLNVYYTQLP